MRALPKKYNVEQVRERYSQLFASYSELARTVAAPDADAPLDLIRRSIKAADRWRSLETDVTAACNEAGASWANSGKMIWRGTT